MSSKSNHIKTLTWLGKMLLENELFLPCEPSEITDALGSLDWAIDELSPKKQKEPKSKAIWMAYSNAYYVRYGHEPPMNASIRAMLCKIVDFVGAEEAPLLAEYYLRLNKPFYVSNHHPVNILLKDYQSVRAQMLCQTNQTTQDVRQVERRSGLASAARSLKDKIARGEI